MKAKGQCVGFFFFFFNMKHKEEEQGGFSNRDKMKIWSDSKARRNMNIMLCSSVMCEEEKERK